MLTALLSVKFDTDLKVEIMTTPAVMEEIVCAEVCDIFQGISVFCNYTQPTVLGIETHMFMAQNKVLAQHVKRTVAISLVK
jgi:hypothetical protein